MKKIKIFIPVDVNERLPKEKNINTLINFSNGHTAIYFNIFLQGEFLDNKGGTITHWLEEKEMYCFTEEEMREEIKDFGRYILQLSNNVVKKYATRLNAMNEESGESALEQLFNIWFDDKKSKKCQSKN